MIWQIAQLNIATALYPPEDERIAGFYAALDDINTLAEASPGFVWRLQSDSGNATDIEVGNDPLILVNMSVWASIDALFDFAYKSAHTRIMAERKAWFAKPTSTYQVLWWVPEGHEPTVEEAMDKLAHLDRHGPTAAAFSFKDRYPPPGHD